MNAAEPAVSDPIVELPKVIVTDSRELPPPEAWRYATIPGFEILSNASDKSTQRLIADFQLFRVALGYIWQVPEKMNTPLLLILCGKGGQFDGFVPPKTEGSPETGRASVYLRGKARSAIVIDMEATIISILSDEVDDPASGVDSTRFSVEHNKQLYREYVHYLLSRSEPRLPAWYEEGFSQVIMAMKFQPDLIEFGKIEDARTAPAGAAAIASANAAATAEDGDQANLLSGAPVEDRDFNVVLAQRAIVPMQKFFEIHHDSPEALNPLGNNTWAKQAYAFVHMCMFGEQGKWKKPFGQFLLRSTREPVTEAMFKECFKMSYKEMGLQLRGYLQYTDYQAQEFRAKKGSAGLPVPLPITLRDATQSEVGRIKGQAKLLAGNVDGARKELSAPYIRGERDPQLLAALGLIEHATGKDDRAKKFLTVAVAGKATDPDAYVELAKLQYAEALAAPAGANKRLSTAQVTSIANLLVTARTLPPPNPATYEFLAEVLAAGEGKPTQEQVVRLIEGVRMYPSKLRLIYATAVLCNEAGMVEAAHSLVDHGLKFSPDATTKANFAKLKERLPPDPSAQGKGAAPAGGTAQPAAAKPASS